MPTDNDLAAQVDAVFTERINEAAATAHTLMSTFILAVHAYERGETDDAENIVYRVITDSDTPIRTTMHLCAAGAGVIAATLDDLDAECDLHGPNCQCDGVTEFDPEAAGNTITRTALVLCNATVRCDHDDMSTLLTDTYNVGGFAQIRRLLLALVQLHVTVRCDIEEGRA